MRKLICGFLLCWALLAGAYSQAVAGGLVGCDTVATPPLMDLTHPPNLGIFKQQLLLYRCTNYEKDIEIVLNEAREWVAQRASQVAPSTPAIVLDIDETALSNWPRIYQDEFFGAPAACSFKVDKCSDKDWQWGGEAPAVQAVLDLYKQARCIDVVTPCTKISVYFITGRRKNNDKKYVPKEICAQAHDNAGNPISQPDCEDRYGRTSKEWTLQNLKKAGFSEVTEDDLRLRPDSGGSVSDYKTKERIAIEDGGKFKILANIGDQESDLVGLHADRAFKVPNPFYFIK